MENKDEKSKKAEAVKGGVEECLKVRRKLPQLKELHGKKAIALLYKMQKRESEHTQYFYPLTVEGFFDTGKLKSVKKK